MNTPSDCGASSTPVTVTIDEDRCTGSGQCEALSEAVFRVGDDGKATIVGDPAQIVGQLPEIIDSCPTAAIRGEGL